MGAARTPRGGSALSNRAGRARAFAVQMNSFEPHKGP